MIADTAAIELSDLTLRFDERIVVQGFRMRLAVGEKATLTGPSGSGKSSVIRSILGFVTPERGTVKIAGQLVTSRSVWDLRRQMAYVPQEADLGVGPVRRILERPFSYRANANLPPREHLLPCLFDRLRLPHHLLDKEITDLSGGEKQRVAIIAAILLDRGIILLDEAASALDSESAMAVADYFREQPDLTILSAAHDEHVLPLSGRVVSIAGGHRA